MRINVVMPKKLRGLDKETLQASVRALATLARERLTTLAQERLKTTAQTYIRGLNTPASVTMTDKGAVIMLVGRLPNMLEKGATAYDLKRGLLKGRKYVDVPFRHGAPGSTRVKAMPQGDFNAMKALVDKAGKSARVRGPKNMPTPAQSKSTPFGSYTQKQSPYGDMLRIKNPYGKGAQGQYMTFRRVSANSDPASWIHPGLKALGLFPQVAKEVRKLAVKVIADYVRKGMR